MTIAVKRNVPGFRDANGVFRPIRSASYVGGGSSRRKATARDRKKYSRAKAGDLGKAKQERALEAPWDRDARLEREAKAAEKREQDRIEKQIAAEVYGETSGRTSRGKGRTLAQFIRSEGGINTKSKVRKGRVRYGDSLENFTRKGSGSSGLVTTTPGKGKSLDYMHQAAREAGYDVASMDDLLDALDNELRSGKKTYSTHGAMAYNPQKRKTENGKRKTAKKNPDLLGMFANAAVGIASTLQINEMIKSRKRAAAPKKRGTTKAKRRNPVLTGKIGPRKWVVREAGQRWNLEDDVGLGLGMVNKLNSGKYQAWRSQDNVSQEFSTLAAAKTFTARRPWAKMKALAARVNPTQPKISTPKGELYVLTIGSGDDLISVYLHDGDKDGFSKRFKTMAGAKSYATRNKVKLVENPKRNGIIKRAWARSRAASEYRRELRQAAALERTRSRRQKAEQAARSNPASFGQTKVAWVRDPNVPAGRPAKGKLRCPCGGAPWSTYGDGKNVKCKCGTVYNSTGWVQSIGPKTPAGIVVNPKKNPRRSANGKTTAARAANGKKAVARSAKANPPHYYAVSGPSGGVLHADTLKSAKEQAKARSLDRNETVVIRDIYANNKIVARVRASAKKVADFRKMVEGWGGSVSWAKKKNPKSATRNPKSTARRRTFEMFQGRRVTTARPMLVSNHAPANLDALGDLIELKIAGGPVLKFNGKGTKLCAANGKLWIAGKRFAKANPSGKPNEINPIGEIDHVVYGTYKPHHGDHNYTHYIHKLGEESGKRPILCVDREGFPVIRGGNYKIEARGIVD